MTFLGLYNPSGNSGSLYVNHLTLFQYVHIIMSISPATGYATTYGGGIQVYHFAGNTTGLVNGTDYTVSSNVTNGVPAIKYTDVTTNTLYYNETTLLLSEAYRRLYPVIRDSSDIILSSTSTALSGYGNVWNIENYNNVLQFNYGGTNVYSISNTGATTQSSSMTLSNGSYAVAFETPTLSANSLYNLPATVSSSVGQFLTVSGVVTGVNNLTWSNLNGTNLASVTPYGMCGINFKREFANHVNRFGRADMCIWRE